jgi:hypothetical protein
MSAPPPPNHPRAVTSLVLGALGVMLCAAVGPFAWWVSRRTLLEIDGRPGRYGGRGMAQAGYILGIVGTVLLAVLLTLVLIAMIGDLLTVTR